MINKELYETLFDSIQTHSKDIFSLRDKLRENDPWAGTCVVDDYISSLHETLVYFRDMGVTQAEMLDTLEELRSSLGEDDEDVDDIVLTLMFEVVGYCNQKWALYGPYDSSLWS